MISIWTKRKAWKTFIHILFFYKPKTIVQWYFLLNYRTKECWNKFEKRKILVVTIINNMKSINNNYWQTMRNFGSIYFLLDVIVIYVYIKYTTVYIYISCVIILFWIFKTQDHTLKIIYSSGWLQDSNTYMFKYFQYVKSI